MSEAGDDPGKKWRDPAKVTQAQAIGIALEFAKSQGARGVACGGVTYTSEAQVFQELGHLNGHGYYMVPLVSDTFRNGNRHWKTGQRLPDEAMTVVVNDQTAQAEPFFRL